MKRHAPSSGDQQLVSSDVSRDRAPTPVPTKEPPRWERNRIQREHDSARIMGVFDQISAHLGGILDLGRQNAPGDVLAAGTYLVPANGVFSRDYPAGFGAITVANQNGGGELAVVSQTPQSQAPTQGVGTFNVPPCIFRTVAVKGTQVTVYGTPGQSFDLIVFSRPRPPAIGVCRGGPIDGVLIPAGTTTTQNITLVGNLERVVLVFNVSAVAGGSVTPVVNGLTPSGYAYPLFTAPAALNAVAVTTLRVGPALTPTANLVANDVVPRRLQVVATVAGSITYGVDFVAG